MSLIPHTSPWQVGPVSSLGRITVGALVALALDSFFLWQHTPHLAVSLAVVLVPVIIAIRAIRGFERSLVAAVTTLGLAGVVAVTELARTGLSRANAGGALAVAVVLCAVGVIAGIAGWLEQRRWSRTAVIELARSTPPSLVPARSRPRVYR